jgi:peptidoglycan/LPS O-acetylase OafA/YrhL
MRARGWIGVDLFFVISGFLITGILVGSRDKPNYYRNFYARRGLRIWPLYYLLLIFVYILSPHLGAWARQDVNLHAYRWPYYLFYVQNLIYPTLGSFSLVITWSLCIEEQFYMVWPFVVRACSRRSLTIVALAVLALGTPYRFYLHHLNSPLGFFFTFSRLDPIAVGALVALHPRWFKYTWALAPLSIWLLAKGDFDWVFLVLALTFGSVVMHAASRGSTFLRAAPLRFVGKVSYGIYILHPITFSIFWLTPLYSALAHWPIAEQLRMLGQILFPIPFAAVSWYLFEQPILKFKRFFESQDAKSCPPPIRALAAEMAD